jgi:hypothetical protein
MRTFNLFIIAPLLLTAGCSFYARDAEDYKKVTRELVETKNASIKECYDVALQTNEKVSGSVVINFTVEKKTGKIMNPVVDEKASTASAEAGTCVATKIDGLGIEQPDLRDGAATFTWNYDK